MKPSVVVFLITIFGWTANFLADSYQLRRSTTTKGAAKRERKRILKHTGKAGQQDDPSITPGDFVDLDEDFFDGATSPANPPADVEEPVPTPTAPHFFDPSPPQEAPEPQPVAPVSSPASPPVSPPTPTSTNAPQPNASPVTAPQAQPNASPVTAPQPNSSPSLPIHPSCAAAQNGDIYVTDQAMKIKYDYELLTYKELPLTFVADTVDKSFQSFLASSLVDCSVGSDSQIQGVSPADPDTSAGGTCQGIQFFDTSTMTCYVMEGTVEVYLSDSATMTSVQVLELIWSTLRAEINGDRRRHRQLSLINEEEGVIALYFREEEEPSAAGTDAVEQETSESQKLGSSSTQNGVNPAISAALVGITVFFVGIVGFAFMRRNAEEHDDKTGAGGSQMMESTFDHYAVTTRSSSSCLPDPPSRSTLPLSQQRDGYYEVLSSPDGSGPKRRSPLSEQKRDGYQALSSPDVSVQASPTPTSPGAYDFDGIEVEDPYEDSRSYAYSHAGVSMMLTTDQLRLNGFSPSQRSASPYERQLIITPVSSRQSKSPTQTSSDSNQRKLSPTSTSSSSSRISMDGNIQSHSPPTMFSPGTKQSLRHNETTRTPTSHRKSPASSSSSSRSSKKAPSNTTVYSTSTRNSTSLPANMMKRSSPGDQISPGTLGTSNTKKSSGSASWRLFEDHQEEVHSPNSLYPAAYSIRASPEGTVASQLTAETRGRPRTPEYDYAHRERSRTPARGTPDLCPVFEASVRQRSRTPIGNGNPSPDPIFESSRETSRTPSRQRSRTAVETYSSSRTPDRRSSAANSPYSQVSDHGKRLFAGTSIVDTPLSTHTPAPTPSSHTSSVGRTTMSSMSPAALTFSRLSSDTRIYPDFQTDTVEF